MSKETKFTKGDWYVGFNKTSVYTGSKVSGEGRIVSQCGRFKFAYRDAEECEANAKLIKTAPSLYAEIESEIEFLKELMEDSHTEYQITLLDEKIEQKQILLAESRGE